MEAGIASFSKAGLWDAPNECFEGSIGGTGYYSCIRNMAPRYENMFKTRSALRFRGFGLRC